MDAYKLLKYNFNFIKSTITQRSSTSVQNPDASEQEFKEKEAALC